MQCMCKCNNKHIYINYLHIHIENVKQLTHHLDYIMFVI